MMPITEKQRIRRRKYIGSSDMAAILGLSPYKTALDVWLEKTGRIDSYNPNEAMILGSAIENVLIDLTAERLGMKFRKNQFRVCGIMAASHDAISENGNAGIEAKTTGLVSFVNIDEWGPDGSDEIPEHIMIQCQHQAAVTPLSIIYVPTLIGGYGLRIYEISPNPEMIEMLHFAATKFWLENVVADVQPPVTFAQRCETLKNRKRNPETVVDVESEIIDQFVSARSERQESDKREEIAKARLLASLGDSEGSACGRVRYTMEGKSRRLRVK